MENNCIQYRVTGGSGGSAGESSPSSNGGMAYRVVNTTEGETTTTTRPSISSSSSALSNVQVKQELDAGLTDQSTLQAVLASPINGQFYVIGNPSDVLGGAGQRTIAPRTGPYTLDSGLLHNKEDKLGTRRATHNEVERRRRDNINNWIMKLSKLIPDCNNHENSQGKHSQSKGGILAKACEYLAETRNTNQRLVDSLKQTEEISAEKDRLSTRLEQLQVGGWLEGVTILIKRILQLSERKRGAEATVTKPRNSPDRREISNVDRPPPAS